MGFLALRAARTPGISTFLYMHGPSLSGHGYAPRRAATTVDPDDSPVNGPFLDDDSLLLSVNRMRSQAKVRTACVPTQETLSILANKVMGSPQSLGNRNASFTPARGIIPDAPRRDIEGLAMPEAGSETSSTLLDLPAADRRCKDMSWPLPPYP